MDLPAPGERKSLAVLPHIYRAWRTKWWISCISCWVWRKGSTSLLAPHPSQPPASSPSITYHHHPHHPPVMVESWPRLPFKPHWCMICCTWRLNKFLARSTTTTGGECDGVYRIESELDNDECGGNGILIVSDVFAHELILGVGNLVNSYEFENVRYNAWSWSFYCTDSFLCAPEICSNNK